MGGFEAKVSYSNFTTSKVYVPFTQHGSNIVNENRKGLLADADVSANRFYYHQWI